MPDMLLDSRSMFDTTKALLGRCLRENARSLHILGRDELKRYSEHAFVSGWRVEVEYEGSAFSFLILLDRQFPYSTIRISLPSDEYFLRWPHVEPGGLLCLPQIAPPTAGIEAAIKTGLLNAIALVRQCEDSAFVDAELRREFISYWNRSASKGSTRVRSLLDPDNRVARQVHVWLGKHFSLVGETAGQLQSWWKNLGKTDEVLTRPGIFGYLNEAPIPPFPERPGDLCKLLTVHCPDALTVLKGLPVTRDITLVLGAGNPVGLMAMDLTVPTTTKGFRGNPNGTAKMVLWKTRSRIERRQVDRFDPAWVHGRGLNRDLPKLAKATILLLGCGSLGSQVAMRLGQAGVGGIHVIDREELAAANVGRHALGISSAGQRKARELADMLREHYPHMHTIKAWDGPWQSVHEREPKLFQEASLIVACLGEWSADGQLGEWHHRTRGHPPIVFGWLDEFGAASHALALGNGSVSLACILSAEGRLRVEETLWKGDGQMQTEPACGNLFQPYGPLDAAHAEALVSRLALDILTGAETTPVHRVYAGPTAELEAAGGEWSKFHLEHRPEGYQGPFEYTRAISPCGECPCCADPA